MEQPQVSFRNYVTRTLLLLGSGLMIAVAGPLLASVLDLDGEGLVSELLIIVPIGFGLVLIAGALGSLLNVIRMKLRIRKYGLRSFLMDYELVESHGNGQPMVRLSAQGESFILTVVALVWRWSRIERASGSEVWFAGTSRRGGVLVLPGAEDVPYWLRRIKLPRLRRSMERRAFGN